MRKISIDEQIAALEITVANRRGFVETLRDLVSKKKRTPIDLEIAENRMPALEAALKTLKWVGANEIEIKNALRRQSQG